MALSSLVIFDLDGTLVDSQRDIANAMNTLLARHDLPCIPTDRFGDIVGDGARAAVARATGYRDDDYDAINALTNEYLDIYRELGSPTSTPYPGIDEMLSALAERDIGRAVLTNKPHDIAVRLVSERFPDDMFREVRGVLPDGIRKPNPRELLGIISRAGLSLERAVFVGDTNTDIRTGLAAAVRTIGCAWGFRSSEELLSAGAHAIIDTPQQLFAHVLDSEPSR